MKMRKIIFAYLLFQASISFGQNVKLEISDYHRKIDDKVYATYQLVNASYSYSRATIVFLTNKATLFDLSGKLQNLVRPKQEYTDIWILGIENFDSKNVTETDKKIIDLFLQNSEWLFFRNQKLLLFFHFLKFLQYIRSILL